MNFNTVAAGVIGAGLALAAVKYCTSRPDPVSSSIENWKNEYAPEENRFYVAGKIQEAHERKLVALIIDDPSITTLPETLPEGMEILDLSKCTNLKELPKTLPDSLKLLNIFNCNNLKKIPALPAECVVVKPEDLLPENFLSTLTAHAVDMRDLEKMAEDGNIESLENLQKIKCPISLSNLNNKNVVLIASSMKDPGAEVTCKLYELESIKCLQKSEAGVYSNPLTREVLRTLDIIDIKKEINASNLKYDKDTGNFKLKTCPDLGYEKDSAPIYQASLNIISPAGLNTLLENMKLNAAGQPHITATYLAVAKHVNNYRLV